MTVDRFPVEAAHVLMFARAIGDPSPAYGPARDGERVLAPPTFVAAAVQFDPDYHLRPRPDRPWFGCGHTATGDPDRKPSGGLHAEQRYEYHRPVRAGVVLRVEDLARTQAVMYAGALGDFNPLHTDEVYATRVAGFPSTFAHGMWTMGATGRVLTDWVGADRLRAYGARFVGKVWPGATLTATVTVEAVREEGGRRLVELAVVTTDQDGVEVLRGTASAFVDP